MELAPKPTQSIQELADQVIKSFGNLLEKEETAKNLNEIKSEINLSELSGQVRVFMGHIDNIKKLYNDASENNDNVNTGQLLRYYLFGQSIDPQVDTFLNGNDSNLVNEIEQEDNKVTLGETEIMEALTNIDEALENMTGNKAINTENFKRISKFINELRHDTQENEQLPT